jgi:hypothetical protein
VPRELDALRAVERAAEPERAVVLFALVVARGAELALVREPDFELCGEAAFPVDREPVVVLPCERARPPELELALRVEPERALPLLRARAIVSPFVEWRGSRSVSPRVPT